MAPVSARKRRAKVRGDISDLRARVSTSRSSSRWPMIHSSSGPKVSLSQSGTARSMNWACPPSRCGGTTIRRAAVAATPGAVEVAHQVQRRVDAGRRAGAGEDVAVVAVEDVGLDLGLGVQLLEEAGVAPVGGALAAVEDAGRAELEGAGAVRVEDRAAVVGRPDRLQHGVVVLEEVEVGREADEVGVGRRLEAALDVEVEVGASLDPAGPRRADAEVEDRRLVLGVLGLAPHLDERAEPERLGAVLDDHGDGVDGTHGGGELRHVGHPDRMVGRKSMQCGIPATRGRNEARA